MMLAKHSGKALLASRLCGTMPLLRIDQLPLPAP
jgi:hypothetical protein